MIGHNLALTRRSVLLGAGSWASLLSTLPIVLTERANAQTPAPEAAPFAPDQVRKLAEDLAASEFVRPTVEAPAPFDALNAEQYRDIKFRPELSVWRGERLDAELQLLPRGWIYDTPVEIHIVENGTAQKLVAENKLFQFGPKIDNAPQGAPFAFSGVRLHGPVNRSDLYDDYAVFQGASYFRAVGRGQTYGLSARGLAVNTAQPGGEEFPIFRAFWIEKPRPAAADMVVHGLLDSKSVAGAYRFVIRPGTTTVIDVDATLFARKALEHAGLAPLTSMFLRSPASRRVNADYRPRVHNSEGLAVLNGRGERLWRPLTNPKTLQTSAFMDKNPKGFGLVQRDRSFEAFEDIAARFENRPSVWVEPRGGWGDGFVELIEIPVEEEIHDNIVVFWKPAQPIETGKPYRFAYRLHWGADVPVAWAPAQVAKTHVNKSKNGELVVFVVDYTGPAVSNITELPVADVSANVGSVANASMQRHPNGDGVRLRFELNPNGEKTVELRAGLKANDQVISESWLYRWTEDA
jgi:periplasmic glucans biosynthesis protein